MWTLEEALDLVRRLAPPVKDTGFGLALGGSVLLEGSSTKDLDLIVFPLNGEHLVTSAFRDVLYGLEWKRTAPPHHVSMVWYRSSRSTDSKHVEVWKTSEGKRVDIFYLR